MDWSDGYNLNDISSNQGLSLQKIIAFNRSRFFRPEPADFYENLGKFFKGRVALWEEQTNGKMDFKVGVFGAAFGQEPISVAIYLDKLIREMKLEGKVNIEVHVFDVPGKVYARVENNTIVYPNEALPPNMADEERAVYFQGENNEFRRSDRLNQTLHFHQYDLLDPPTALQESLNLYLFTMHNVLQ